MLNPPKNLDDAGLFEFYYSLNRKIIRVAGIDSASNISPRRLLWNRALFASFIILMTFVIVPQTYVAITRHVTFTRALEIAGTDLLSLDALFKACVLLYHRDALAVQEATWKSLWSQTISPDEMTRLCKYGKLGRTITCGYLITGFILVTSYGASPLVIAFRDNFNEQVALPYYINLEFNSNLFIAVMFVAQIFSGMTLGVAIIGIDLIIPVFILQACGQLSVLKSRLSNIEKQYELPENHPIRGNENGIISARQDHLNTISNTTGPNMTDCIKHHQAILHACTHLEESLNPLGLIQAVCAVYHICLSGVGIIMVPEESYKFCLHIMTSLYQLFLFCWTSDKLITESTGVANAAFSLPWYNWSPSEKMNAEIMIRRAQKGCRITAGKFYVLSLEAYTQIVSNGFSAFAVLRTMM